MSLLMDAPPAIGVVEALEALPFEHLSVGEAGEVVRAVAAVRGRIDVVEAKALAVFARGNGAQAEGATDTTSWLASATKTSGRDAKRSVKRAGVLDALPELGEALAAGEISAAHVDEIAAIVPPPLLPKAARLVAAAKSSTPEELARAAQQLVIDNDGDGGAARALRLKARQRVRFFDLDSGMRAMFGEWDPQTTAAIERAVDLVADELWRAEHPTRHPTRLEETSLKFRRAQAVTEIARRVLAGAQAVAANTDDDGAAHATADDNDAAAAAHAAHADDDGAATANDASAAAASAKAPIRSKRAMPPKSRSAVPLLSVLIDHQTLLGQLAANGICQLFEAPPSLPTPCAAWRVTRRSSRWCWVAAAKC